jgi:formylglycine-generating enzyme required for sulfatase activity
MDWGLARVMGRPDSHDLKPAPLDLVSKSTSIRTERQEFKEHSPDSPLITKYGDVIGTPSYMAPEQAQGLVDNIGPQSDVYAIGAILYHLLCGQMPYVPKGARASHHTVLAAHLMGPPKPVLEIDPTAPPELADICAKAMAREPKRRYATALDMARDIENYLGNRPVSARPASLAYVARLAYKRHKAVVSVAGLAAVALLAFGGFHYVQMGRTVVAKEAALAVSTRLADLNSARALIAQADEVFAPLPERVRRLDAWLGRVNGLIERKTAYERLQAEGDTRAAGEARELLAYVADLERLEPFRHKHRNDVIALEPALDSPEWRAACDDIAHLPVYAGLELAPQWGIEPLQKNPATGLWEFWCPLSGDRPRIANATSGALKPEEKMAIVLVLLPGGKFMMGAPLSELGEQSLANEREHEELLAPFFAAKYEVSQGQWRRLMESNPAFYALSDLHPVESVSALDCDEYARRLGAALPTEAQWEYACRGGRKTAFWMGDEASTLQTENTLDVSGAPLGLGSPSEWDDGQRVHAPIGFSGANPYGLFDVHGNVAEWCCDFQSRPGDASTVKPRNFRGGSFAQPPQYCRAAYRSWDNPKGLNHARGLRVVRAIDP